VPNIPTWKNWRPTPNGLKELRQQCKTDRPKLGDVLCNRVAEATRKRFYGDGETPYTPPKSEARSCKGRTCCSVRSPWYSAS
jgi:hypothetical protein